MIHQHLAPFYFCCIDVIAFAVGVLGCNAVGGCATINLRDDDAGILCSTAHGQIFVHPLIMGSRHRERTEESHVLLLHPLHERIITNASHRHEYHPIGTEFMEHLFTVLARTGHGIDIEPLLGEQGNEGIDVLTITFHGEGDAGNQGEVLCPLMIDVLLLQVFC